MIFHFSTYLHQHTYKPIMSSEQIIEVGEKLQNASLVSLHDQLDALWIRYLTLLHDYTNAQAAIKKHMSSGFFTLAQANFKSNRGRYGQDYYDQRAVATTRVNLQAKNESISLKVEKRPITTAEQPTAESAKENSSASEKKDVESPVKSQPVQLPSPEATPEPETRGGSANPEADTKSDSTADHEKPRSHIDTHDPIRWFGILVPSTLRQAQKSFSSALLDEGSVTKAVNCSRGMREVEIEIRKLRKAIKKEEKKVNEVVSITGKVETVS